MIQKPYSYTEAIKSDVTHKSIYIPIDPMDHVFHKAADPSDEVALRSPIFMKLAGCTPGMTFQIKLHTLIEYIPLGEFCGWVDSKMRPPDLHTLPTVQEVAVSNPKELFKAQVPQMPNRMPKSGLFAEIKKLAKKGVKIASR